MSSILYSIFEHLEQLQWLSLSQVFYPNCDSTSVHLSSLVEFSHGHIFLHLCMPGNLSLVPDNVHFVLLGAGYFVSPYTFLNFGIQLNYLGSFILWVLP